MVKLLWDGTPQDSPDLGLSLIPGEHEYPDDKAEKLIALGLKPAKAKKAAATKEE